MSYVNAALRPLFDLLLAPFAGVAPIVSLLLVSLLTSIGMLVVFKRTSNQAALSDVKRRIHAGLFEIRLFNDDLRAIRRVPIEILEAEEHSIRWAVGAAGADLSSMRFCRPMSRLLTQLQHHYGDTGGTPHR